MLTLKRIFDDKEINLILMDDEIFNRISEDGQLPENSNINIIDSHHWVGVYVDNEIIGIYWLHPIGVNTAFIHINILKKYRKKYSLLAGIEMMKYLLLQKSVLKVEAKIPIIYQSVYLFSLKMGFVKEGVLLESFLKGGRMIDQYSMGITREGIAEWLRRGVN